MRSELPWPTRMPTAVRAGRPGVRSRACLPCDRVCALSHPQTVECEEGSEDDESLREMVELAAQRLYEALTPVH